MKLNTVLTGACLLALAGCAEASKPVTLDGLNRQPINVAADVKDLSSRQSQATIIDRSDTALARQIKDQARQIEELKAYLVMLQVDQEAKADGPVSKAKFLAAKPAINPIIKAAGKTSGQGKAKPLPVSLVPTPSNLTELGNAAGGPESVHLVDQGVVFRVSGVTGKSFFQPSQDMQKKLLEAAMHSDRIVIRGRTDANHANPKAREIALARALRASNFLIKNGVPANKIRITYLSSGDNVADNETLEGRAQNRRVEIEMTGADQAALSEVGRQKSSS